MRIVTSRTHIAVAVIVAVALTLVAYALATSGIAALAASSAREHATYDAEPTLPKQLYNAEDTVATTSSRGPVGPVSLVYPGTDVRVGLSGELSRPWLAVSGVSGEYRALDVPNRPPAERGAMSVAPDGDLLAWGSGTGVWVYDAVADRGREIVTRSGTTAAGAFSPDGSRLVAHAGRRLVVVDARSGATLATVGDVTAAAAEHAAWSPDGSAVGFVRDGSLELLVVDDDRQRAVTLRRANRLADDTPFAWDPAGTRLAVQRADRGVNVVDVYEVDLSGAGAVDARRVFTARPPRFATQRLLGFPTETHVAVVGLQAESGAIESIFWVSVRDESAPVRLTQLAGPGPNWRGADHLAVAAGALTHNSRDFGAPSWPASDQAKLTACSVAALFLFGMYLTRPLGRRQRRRGRRLRGRSR